MVSSHASRVCTTRVRSWRLCQRDLRRERRRAAPAGASGRSGSRARTPPPPPPSSCIGAEGVDQRTLDARRRRATPRADAGPSVAHAPKSRQRPAIAVAASCVAVATSRPGHRLAGRRRRRCPTQTTPADAGRGRLGQRLEQLVAPSGRYWSWRWQCESIHRPARLAVRWTARLDGPVTHVRRGNSGGALLHRPRHRGSRPSGRVRGNARPPGAPSKPEPAPDLGARCRAWPASASRATMRSASSALPRTASTAGPGSAFQGSVASSSALVSRMRRHVASSARCGCAVVPRRRWPRRRRRRPRARSAAVGIGSGPDATALRPDHRGHPGHQVPEVVGQIGVVAGGDALVGEVAVGPERGVAQQVVPDGVDAEVRR